MLDLGHLPTAAPQDVKWFVGQSRQLEAATFTWTKPRGVTMIQILAIGQGGDGVTGNTGASATGGAGGGSGGQSIITIPASFLPQVLYIGGGAGGSGTAVHSFVSVKPNGATANSQPVASDMILRALGAIGLANTAANAETAAGCILSGLGIARFIAGDTGGNGGSTAGSNGSNSSAPTTGIVVRSGAGGGGMSATVAGDGGTDISAFPTFLPNTKLGSKGTSGVDGGKGGNGVYIVSSDAPLCFNGGGGGGAGFPTATTSNGGNGGAGGYGCGGGGGGGAVTGKTAGVGGKGGPGLVIITCW